MLFLSKNTPQENPTMSSGWNAARRAVASERMHARKPWLKSTGPRTVQGKARTRMNALKHGGRSAAVINERRAAVHYLRQQRAFLQQVRLLLRLRRHSAKTQKTTIELKDLHTSPLLAPSDRHRKNAGNPREFLLNMANFAHPGTGQRVPLWIPGQAGDDNKDRID
jgi:hypothetical protein